MDYQKLCTPSGTYFVVASQLIGLALISHAKSAIPPKGLHVRKRQTAVYCRALSDDA